MNVIPFPSPARISAGARRLIEAGDMRGEVYVTEAFEESKQYPNGKSVGFIVVQVSDNGNSASTFGPFDSEREARAAAPGIARAFGSKLFL